MEENIYGYSLKCARIDLTKGTIKIEYLSKKFCEEYIGGYGFIAKILWDEFKPGTDALDPSVPLIWCIGPFPGTILPTSSKYGVGAKSPLTNRFGFGISSGSFGAQMRRAGWNMFIITGKAPEPSFIYIENDNINIIPCKDSLWGKDTWTTEDEIRSMFSDQRIAVAAIGPAGERLVKFACITNDRNRQVGRTGMGCVMGSKNLKAIAVKGTNSIPIYNPKKFMERAKELIKLANSSDTLKYRLHGTPVNTMNFNKLGVLPTKNFQTGYWDKAYKVSGEEMSKVWVVKKAACSQCPIACDHIVATKPDDPDWPNVFVSMDFESLFGFGPLSLVDHFPAIIKAVELCDRLGMDSISSGIITAFAMEAYEKGYITKEMLGDNPVYKNGFNWGDGKAEVQMVEDIAYRKTKCGDILAEGVRKAAKILGGEAYKFAMHGKGLEHPGYELKGLKTASIGFAVSPRGMCHLRNNAYGPDVKGDFDRLTFDKIEDRVKYIAKQDSMMAIIDSLIVCKFTRGIYKDFQEMAEVYEMVTGIQMDGKKLEMAGQRIVDLAKCFNIRECHAEGIEPISEDTLPWRHFHEPNLDGPTKGAYINEEEFKKGIIAYYIARGWDEKGYPKPETLKMRGLEFVIGKI